MDKNTIIGFILIAAVLIGFSIYNKPSEEEIKAQEEWVAKQEAEQKKAQEEKQKAKMAQEEKQKAMMEDTTALFYNSLTGTKSDVVLKNKSLELTLSTKGGIITKAVVKGYKNIEGKDDVTLFEEKDQLLAFKVDGKNQNINTADLYFTPSQQTDSTVTMTAQAGEGKELRMEYKLGENYMLHFSLTATGMENDFSSKTNTINLDWQQRVRQQEKGYSFENRFSTLTYKEKNSGTDYLNETKEIQNERIEETLDWVAFKNQFFSSLIIAKDDFASDASLSSIPQEKGSGYLKEYKASLTTKFDPKGKETYGTRNVFRS